MQIIVTVERMLFKKEKWFLFLAEAGGDGVPEMSVKCKGRMGWEPQVQETLALIGDWVVYKGERQFQFRAAKLTLPLEPRSQLHYVCQRTGGIGPSTEQAIWDARKENWRDLQRGEIRRMRDETYNRFQEQIRSFEGNKEKAEIVSWLESKGCSQGMAADAYEAWGSDTAGIVQSNCYRLADLPGYSFKVVDENIRRNFEIADDDPRRIRSGVEYALQRETEDGSTAVDCFRHLGACEKLLPNIGREVLVEHVRAMADEGVVHVFRPLSMMALKRDYVNESLIHDFVSCAASAGSDSADLPEEELWAGEKFKPDATQIAAVRFAVSRRFAIINGGAGVGKTTVIKMIVRGLRKLFPQLQVSLCAPTGKAAARLKEASGIEATTIHVLLGSRGGDVFSAGPLEDCAVISDEASMIDSALLAEIMKRRPARLVLVGDQAQLTPVGHGQPFHDIIGLYPEMVRTLTKCYRNTEAVFQAATKIRTGNLPVRCAQSENERWCVVAAREAEEAQDVIRAWAKEGYLDFETDIVLCPKNGKRPEGGGEFPAGTVNALNEELLHLSRESRGLDRGEKFQSGDRVINTVNTPEAQVWNGTTGTVQMVNDGGEVFVKLDVPVRGADGELKDSVKFTRDMVKNLQYAYALTIHKSQGSQYRKTVMVILARDGFQLDRSLIYTGVTRTKQECLIVGDYNALARGIETTRKKDTVLGCLAAAEEVSP